RIFYSRVKGEVERGLEALHFPGLALFQPSLLTVPRREKRRGERIGTALFKWIDPLLAGPLAQYHSMPHALLAKALVAAALDPQPGPLRCRYPEIRRLAGE